MTTPLKLSADERRDLIDSLGGDTNYLITSADDPGNTYWCRIEITLGRILAARAALIKPAVPPNTEHLRPPASGGSAIVVNVTSSGHEINLLDDIRNSIVAQQHNNALARRSRSW